MDFSKKIKGEFEEKPPLKRNLSQRVVMEV
jgi:hypothetical protein